MKKLSSMMKLLTIVAVCSFLVLPAVSSADQVFGPVECRLGTTTETFYIGAGARSFSVAPGLKSLSISVQNGSQKNKDRVSSAYVTVNGEEIFVPNNFNQNVSSLIKTVDVSDPAMSEIALEVKVKGKKAGRLFVTVEAIYEEAPVTWYLDTDYDGLGGRIEGMGTASTPPPTDPRGMWVRQGGDRE